MEGEDIFFNQLRGYGFIKVDGLEKDVYVHQSDLGDVILSNDDKVWFEVTKEERGPRAKSVKNYKLINFSFFRCS